MRYALAVAGSLLQLLALGGFAATKTTLCCFCLATSWSEAPTSDLSLAPASDAGSHIPLEDLQACLQGAECEYLRLWRIPCFFSPTPCGWSVLLLGVALI